MSLGRNESKERRIHSCRSTKVSRKHMYIPMHRVTRNGGLTLLLFARRGSSIRGQHRLPGGHPRRSFFAAVRLDGDVPIGVFCEFGPEGRYAILGAFPPKISKFQNSDFADFNIFGASDSKISKFQNFPSAFNQGSTVCRFGNLEI